MFKVAEYPTGAKEGLNNLSGFDPRRHKHIFLAKSGIQKSKRSHLIKDNKIDQNIVKPKFDFVFESM